MPLLTELLARAGLPLDGSAVRAALTITAITHDSREVTPGALFVAIPGTRVNGAAFIDEAIGRGAAAVVYEQEAASGISVAPPAVAVPVANARLALARLAAAYYPQQPPYVVGITGTNGKTSTAEFYRQLWAADGGRAASIGTLGLKYDDGACGRGDALDAAQHAAASPEDDRLARYPQGLTSPDALLLQRTLAALAQHEVPHVGLECSSHGLDQYRLDGVRFAATAFTNLTHEHLDYHGTMERYFAAKARLFTELTPADQAVVLNADDAYGRRLMDTCRARGLTLYDYGARGQAICLHAIEPHSDGLRLHLLIAGRDEAVDVPIYGAFQAHNIAAAIGLAMATGMAPERCIALLPRLAGVHGRMERVGIHPNGAPIFIDYAHTPDALENVLRSLRSHTAGALHVVFGCGGDRDTSKRPQMGRIAAQYAEQVIITDDNPRHEDPASIRAAIRAGAPKATEIGDRRAAIVAGIQQLQANDVLIIAGKGHEAYQMIGDTRYDFDDARIIKEALNTL